MPKFGLKMKYRNYECTVCGNTQMIQTNHTDKCYDHCSDCSWKSQGFGPGILMFGTFHRLFKFIGLEGELK
jgi:predicted nucleic acid-binding Zn ribbon protein